MGEADKRLQIIANSGDYSLRLIVEAIWRLEKRINDLESRLSKEPEGEK